MEMSSVGNLSFTFRIQCLDSKMLLNNPHGMHVSEQIDLNQLELEADFNDIITDELDSFVGERKQNKILLITANLLDKLAFEITLKDLNLNNYFVGVSSVQDAALEIA